MKYEANFVIVCLKNYEIMKHEHEIAYIDAVRELQDLEKNLISLGINYGERVQSSNISDTIYCLFIKKEEKTRILQKRIKNEEETIEALDRVILVFRKFLDVAPKHYYIVDRMMFSDRDKVLNIKAAINKGCDTITKMKKNLIEAIGLLARSDYSNEEIVELEASALWDELEPELAKKMMRNEG